MCIQYPDGECELKSGLIHLLPKFHGLAGEDPYHHLKEFHVVCSSMRPTTVTEEHIKLKAFPFSLQDAAKNWLYCLPPGSINTWETLKRLFLEKFFPASRVAAIRKDIYGIRQQERESLHEYWERFKKLCASCPHHQINEHLLIQYFYEGLSIMDRQMIDAASGGSLVDKTPTNARQLIETMASNHQQFFTRSNSITLLKGTHGVEASYVADHKKLEGKLDDLAAMVRTLTDLQKKPIPSTLCGICASTNHPTEACSMLKETGTLDNEQPQEYAANIYGNNRPPRQQYNHDLSSNKYNPDWKEYPSQKWGNQQPQHQQVYVPPQQRQQPQPATTSGDSNMEAMMKMMADMMKGQINELKQTMEATNQNLQNQIGQMANELNQMKSQQGSSNLPAQTVINPRNVSAITLRSVVPNDERGRLDEATQATSEMPTPSDNSRLVSPNTSSENPSPYSPPPPYPNRLKPKTKKMEELDKEILNTFKKVEINIPLLDAVRQIPKYAKFLKELCTHKRRIMDKEVVNMGRNVSSLIKKPAVRMPQKCKDPGMFSVPCIIGSTNFDNAMLDLGASINVMPLYVFTSLHLGPLKSTGVVIQLANRSTVNPAGVLEDVLVRVDKLIFPTDFYILDMKDDEGMSSTTIILGRPFMMTARTKIDVHAGSLTMEIGDEKVQFNVLEAMKHPIEDHSLFCIDLLSNVVNNYAFGLLDVLSGFSSSLDFSKEVTKLLQAGIIYPISDSTWVSPVHVVPKKSGITVVKNEKNELIPTRIQNSWRVCIDYRRLNQATRKDHFPLPFMDQMLDRLASKSHYCFLDGFSGYFQICIALEDQHKTTFTCPFGTYAYRKMPFGLCNAPGTFQRCMMSIFTDLLEHCIEVFMDDFSGYGSSFDHCLSNLARILERCEETNLVLNFEKCHFMVEQGIVLGHVVSKNGISVDPAKIDIISQLPYPSSVKEVRSFLGHAGFYRRFIKDFS
ncbi:uncharacterized protein LOC114174533, partial [Vigna unguiculata]|uniref:uncharacterized protein LOC114174533 n=1 Tax=Vigna unguiculata TaxID=3917 RepID=UPI001016CA03